jgi:hypothetical protein
MPDPVLTANIYCAHCEDQVLGMVISKLRKNFRIQGSAGWGYLWFVRYGRCGAHLKLRVHAPPMLQSRLKDLLRDAIEAYFASDEMMPEPASRLGYSSLPPLDREDELETLYPNRTLLWTEYRRSPISLGGAPFLHDDGYVARLTRCLGAGCEVVLDLFENVRDVETIHSRRQSTLFALLLSALAATFDGWDERISYLAYHRDWLIRFILQKRNAAASQATDVILRFDARLNESIVSVLETLRQAVLRNWFGCSYTEAVNEWSSALCDLRDYIKPLCAAADYRLDPFALTSVFTPLFKILHGIGNQLGLDMLNEAFAYHHLLRAAMSALSEDLPTPTAAR